MTVTVGSMAVAATAWGIGRLVGAGPSGEPSTGAVPAAVGPAPGGLDLAIWLWLLAGLCALLVGVLLSGRRPVPGAPPVVADPSGADDGTTA